MNHGRLFGVGVGPGDPELLTRKAYRIMKACDILVLPNKSKEQCIAYKIAREAVPEIEQKEIYYAPVPMTSDIDRLNGAYDEIAVKLVGYLDRGLQVVFLNLGDPTIYGSYLEVHNRIVAKGYEAEIVSGVPSFCAVAARLETALVTRKEQFHLIPGAYTVAEDEDLDNSKKQILRYLYENGQVVLMKSGKEIERLKPLLLELETERIANISGAINCGMENELLFHSVKEIPEEVGYLITILIQRR